MKTCYRKVDARNREAMIAFCPSPHPLDRFSVKIRDSFSYVHLLFLLVSTLGIGFPRWSFQEGVIGFRPASAPIREWAV